MEKRQRRRELEQLEREVEDLQRLSQNGSSPPELEKIRAQVSELRREFYTHLGAWQRTQIARHPQRPYTLDFIRLLCTDFSELHGDRAFGDDPAIVGGFARFHGRPVLVLGHQKGRDTKQRVARNFGQAKPEGYRKALRLMKLAAKFSRPILTFVDTPGAYPGLDAEERGQAEAIAVGDQINMLENSIYSVISPEGCASILWRDAAKAELAAEALRITAKDLREFGIVDEIVPEPEGGAHSDHEAAAQLLEPVLVRALDKLSVKSVPELLQRRYSKFRRMGQLAAAVTG